MTPLPIKPSSLIKRIITRLLLVKLKHPCRVNSSFLLRQSPADNEGDHLRCSRPLWVMTWWHGGPGRGGEQLQGGGGDGQPSPSPDMNLPSATTSPPPLPQKHPGVTGQGGSVSADRGKWKEISSIIGPPASERPKTGISFLTDRNFKRKSFHQILNAYKIASFAPKKRRVCVIDFVN